MRKTFKYRLYPTRKRETLPELKNGLRLSKVGTIPIVLHRSVEGTIKTCNIPRSSTGKWRVTFSCENISAKRLVQAQWKLELQEKGSPERKKAKKIVAKLHEGMMFKRTGFAHKESAKIVRQYGRIFVEDIHINEMNSHRCLNENIRDVAWLQFFSFLSYKALSAGREFKKINPPYTVPGLFLLRTQAENAPVRPVLPLSVLRDEKGSEPQRRPEYFETCSEVSGLASRSSAVCGGEQSHAYGKW